MNVIEELKNIFALQKVRKILFAIIVVIGATALLLYGLSKYGEWSLQKDIKNIIEAQNRPYLEDTYGGKTPKETLDLFITAIEKEDFTLASKYFVLSKQGEWRNKLTLGKENNNINNFLLMLKEENNLLDYNDPTESLGARQLYTVGDKMLITFIKYPKGIWKIQEL